MKKEFIKDGNKVRRCTSNESNMNILEWIYYYHDYFSDKIIEAIVEFIKAFFTIIQFTIFIIVLILFPITFPIIAYLNIKIAKEEMIQLGEYNRKGV